MSIRPVVPKIFQRYVEQGCEATQFPTKVMEYIFQMAFFDHFYSRKGLTETQKLQKQTQFALKEGEQNKKKGISDADPRYGYLIDPHKTPFCDKTLSKDDLPRLKELYSTEMQGDYAVAQSLGSKGSMEDHHFVRTLTFGNETVAIYCVFDGHSDKQAAGKYFSLNFGKKISELLTGHEINDENVTNALTSACVQISEGYVGLFGTESGGTTAVCMVRTNKRYYFANVGDSRVVKTENDSDTVMQLSEDANVSNSRFCSYYKFTKNTIENDSVWSPDHKQGLRMARDIGSYYLCARPKITFMDRDKEISGYFVLASDGLWDVATTREAAHFITKMHDKDFGLDEIATSVVYCAHETSKRRLPGYPPLDYADNILALVIKV